ncbi:MAG: hypothetical protein LV471_06000 [Nitrosomonas sp.]|nr:hypothetical protein [Nitrosomonas sp.]
MANFKQIADFDVARYMGVRSGLSKCADGFFRDLFVGHNNAFPDETLHGAFDWDGEIIYVPCGYESAFNAWSSIGRFLKHVQSNHDANRKACFVYHCAGVVDGGIIFGNNRKVFCASVYTNTAVQEIFDAKGDCTIDMQSLSVTTDGTIVFKADHVLYILSRSDDAITGYITQTIPLNSRINRFKLLENERDNDFSYVAASEMIKPGATLEGTAKLWLISLKSSSVINRLEMEHIFDFSRHPYKPELIVLGRKLILLSLPDLKTIRSVALSFTGDTGNADLVNTNVVYSPNGQYFALTYADNGDVEIRGAGTLETVYTFNGRGFPLVDMAWDSTGNYLACRFAVPSDPTKSELTVFDIRSQEIVFNITTNHKKEQAGKYPETIFRWSPRTTELACLIDNQRIRIYKPA